MGSLGVGFLMHLLLPDIPSIFRNSYKSKGYDCMLPGCVCLKLRSEWKTDSSFQKNLAEASANGNAMANGPQTHINFLQSIAFSNKIL